ncbi:hypothetical protein DL96DRAFT_1622052 [Flagelloscypha sp. PMI_526]|nr:hypothetical protein DL96DRAFT_1622052 [Flagelloscypha sp. PMI_526]
MKRSSSSDLGVTYGTARDISGQLQRLFYLGLSSFVFPCVLNIISVIICYNGDAFTYVFMANFYFQIIGVLLATIWVSKERSNQHSDSAYPACLPSSLPFHATTVEPGRTGASDNLSLGPVNHVEGQSHIYGAGMMQLDSIPPTPVDYTPPKENIV